VHYFILIVLSVVLSTSFLVELGAPGPVKFIPEMLSAFAAIFVIFGGIQTKFRDLPREYLLLFSSVMILIICGAIANQVGTGPILAGARYFIRAIPFFFLSCVYVFSERQIRQQLLLLVAFSIVQFPIAVFQLLTFLHQGRFAGDSVYGTLVQSGTLSIFLISGISLLVALVLRERTSKIAFAALALWFLAPTTINETKITFFFLPMCLITPVLIATPSGKRVRMFGFAVVMLLAFGSVFVPVYDYMGQQNLEAGSQMSIGKMFTEKDYFKKYLDQSTQVGDTKKEVGRVDSLLIPLAVVSGDPVTFAFGFGLGNASISSMGTQFSGAQSALYGRYATGGTGMATILLELGLLGAICVLRLHWIIARDAMKVARSGNSLICAIAVAWPAIVLLLTVCLFYMSTIIFEGLSYPFWYFSGMIASERLRMARSRSEAPVSARTPFRAVQGLSSPVGRSR
jgi:hypothetical protein